MNELSLVEFADNPEPRCPCILLVDTSSSMHGAPNDQLQQGLLAFKDALMEDDLASRRVEVCVIGYGYNGVNILQDFITADDFCPPQLIPNGLTPMGEAINLALDQLASRKRTYKKSGISYFRPWIFLITDGYPTDDVQMAKARIHQGEDNQEFAFFAVGVQDADMGILNDLSKRSAIKLQGLAFREMFRWLSQSLVSVSQSKPGEQTALAPPGWGTV